jgi:hypothetical protein
MINLSWKLAIQPTSTNVPSSAYSQTSMACCLTRSMSAGVPDGDTITVHCAGKTFTHQIRDDNDQSPEFVSDKEDPITVRLADEERRRLERAI